MRTRLFRKLTLLALISAGPLFLPPLTVRAQVDDDGNGDDADDREEIREEKREEREEAREEAREERQDARDEGSGARQDAREGAREGRQGAREGGRGRR